jgi:hypothetical protein
MNHLILYTVPQWVAITFLLTIPLPFVIIGRYVRKTANEIQNKWAFGSVMAFFFLYLAYIAYGSLTGWYAYTTFPPKVLLYTTFPFAFLLFFVVLNTNIYKTIVENTAMETLVSLHLFRVIGVFFIILALYDALPKPFAFIAGAGDMLTAISSVYVARAIVQKKSYARKLTYIWNILGTVDILFTAIAANILTKISIDTGAMGVDVLAVFPYCIIPAFAPPAILFLHWTIFKKIKKFSV